MRALVVNLLLTVLAVPSASCGDQGVAPDVEPEISILFIGNSLTMANDLTGMVASLLDSAGVGPTYVGEQTAGNTGLEDHWAFGGLDAIRSGGWDYVVLQQGPSATEGRPSLLDYAQRFADEIRAVGGNPALYMVWPSLDRNFDFDGVSDSYTEAARLADAVLLPAGDVWRQAWGSEPTLAFYSEDGFHPSVLGSFAAAVTIAAALGDVDPRSLPHRFQTPAGNLVEIDEDAAGHVKNAAAERLFGN